MWPNSGQMQLKRLQVRIKRVLLRDHLLWKCRKDLRGSVKVLRNKLVSRKSWKSRSDVRLSYSGMNEACLLVRHRRAAKCQTTWIRSWKNGRVILVWEESMPSFQVSRCLRLTRSSISKKVSYRMTQYSTLSQVKYRTWLSLRSDSPRKSLRTSSPTLIPSQPPSRPSWER